MKFVMNQLERMCIKSHKQFLLVMQRMASLWNELFCIVMQMFSSGSPFYRTNITENRKRSLSLSALKFNLHFLCHLCHIALIIYIHYVNILSAE